MRSDVVEESGERVHGGVEEWRRERGEREGEGKGGGEGRNKEKQGSNARM